MRPQRPLVEFLLTLGALLLLRIVIGYIQLPIAILPWVNLALGAVYLGVPILAIFRAASYAWTVRTSLAFLVSGLAIWGGGIALRLQLFRTPGPATGALEALTQLGLVLWCVGLGALLATGVREKNILVPIAVFLAIYDMFLVLTPVGPTAQFLEKAPEVLQKGGASLPAVAANPTTGQAAVSGYIGPADFVFLGALFVALFRFNMRTAETLRWMIPVLIAYMIAVLVFGLSLPALVPIGLVFMFVNWREFRLSRDEKISTLIVAALGLALLAWGLSQPRPKPAAPSPPASAPEAQAPGGSPAQEVPGSRP